MESQRAWVAIDEDGLTQWRILATTLQICEYALISKVFDIDDVVSSSSLELENQVQDEFKEMKSMVEEVV